jgi:hypothetical protein
MELRSVLRSVDGLIAACIEDHDRTTAFGETDDDELKQFDRGDSVESYRREFDGDAYDEEIVDEDGDGGEDNDDDDEESISRFFGDDDSFLEGDEDDRIRYLPWNCHQEQHDSTVGMQMCPGTTTASAARHLDPASRLNALGPLLDRVGRVCVSLAPHVSVMGEDYPVEKDHADDTSSAAHSHREDKEEINDKIDAPLGRSQEEEEEEGVSNGEDEDDLFSTNVQSGLTSDLSNDGGGWWDAEPDMADYSNAIVNDSPPIERSPARSSTPRNQNRGGGSSSLADNITSALLAAALVNSASTGGGGRGGTGIGATAAARGAQPNNGNGAGGPRLINLGSGNVMRGGPGLGSGIDIHVTMLVSSGGGGGTVGAGAGAGLGGVSAQHVASTNNALMTPTAAAPYPSVGNDEQDDGLFDELYTETPSPVAWDRSPIRDDDDDSSDPPSTFDSYDDDDDDDDDEGIDDDCSVDDLSHDDSSVESEPPVLSEIESNDDSEEEDEVGEDEVGEQTPAVPSSTSASELGMASSIPSTPSTPNRAANEHNDGSSGSEPAPSPSSRSTPRRSPLSRLFRRSRRRRNI